MALFKTSKEAREIMEELRRRTSIRPNLWARAALGYSLSLEADPETGIYDSDGSEFPENVFFGDDGPVILALLRQRTGRQIKPNEAGSIIKPYVERGLRLFKKEFDRVNKRGDELILYLIKKCSIFAIHGDEIIIKQLEPIKDNLLVAFELGSEIRSRQAVKHYLNEPGSSPHIAIMGRNGTGKTRTGLSILEKIAFATSNPIPFLIFDYAKGDIAANKEFIEKTKAEIISLPDKPIPLAPLFLRQKDDTAIHLAARRFRDTIRSVVQLGAIQSDRCLHLITEAYRTLEGETPDLPYLTKIAEERYEDEGMRPDSLLACLREFTTFPLFKSGEESEEHNFFKSSHIIDIHRLPEDLRKLAVFLVLDRLYSEIMSWEDAPLDKEGNRKINLIIVIDEAHHYLPCKQTTLENMVREVRSKGVSIMLLSQSPDDFDQGRYNFAREIGLAIVFSCIIEKPKMIESLLGGKINPHRLSQLGTGVALTRVSRSNEPVEIEVWRS